VSRKLFRFHQLKMLSQFVTFTVWCIELFVLVIKCCSEVNLKVRNAVPDITVYLGDKLDRLSTFYGPV